MAMKVYLGISTDEAFARVMKQEGQGPLAVFWMRILRTWSRSRFPLCASLRLLSAHCQSEAMSLWANMAVHWGSSLVCGARHAPHCGQPLLALKFADCPAG
jgi:hypothetical protein